MRLLIFSNAPWAPTGYGQQTAQLTRRLVRDGHTVAIAANFGLMGTTLSWEGVPVLPGGYDKYSADILPHHAADFEADWIITLYDAWVLPDLSAFRTACWVPVDHQPVPPAVTAHLKGVLPLAMSRFGQAELAHMGINARYVPHAIEPAYHPSPSEFRRLIDIPPDAFLVMVNGANIGNMPARKAWWEMLSGFKIFANTHPDAYLYLHTDPTHPGGVDIAYMVRLLELVDRGRVVPQYPYRTGGISPERMAEAYTAADVLLASSMGEGFGIPVIESQACGTPVIVTDFSAQPELVGAGWKVGWQPWLDGPQASVLALPSIASIAKALGQAYEARGTLSESAITFAAQYDADTVYATHWRPVLAEMAAKLVKQQSKRKKRKRR